MPRLGRTVDRLQSKGFFLKKIIKNAGEAWWQQRGAGGMIANATIKFPNKLKNTMLVTAVVAAGETINHRIPCLAFSHWE